MCRLTFLKIILLFCATIVAQNYGVINYQVVGIDSTYYNPQVRVIPQLSEIDDEYLKTNFSTIHFNDTIAFCKKIDFNYTNEDIAKSMFSLLILGNYQSCVQYNKTKINITENQRFNIKRDFTNQWTLTSDIKIIEGKKCYKAYFEEESDFGKLKVIAWYCPEIPYSYGPKGYCGLPGLIVELTDYNSTLRLAKLTFQKDPIVVRELKVQNTITHEQYIEYLKIESEKSKENIARRKAARNK